MSEGAISHPDMLAAIVLPLWSINERLANREGLDLPMPTNRYIDDIVHILRDKADNDNQDHPGPSVPYTAAEKDTGPSIGRRTPLQVKKRLTPEERMPPELRRKD